MINKKETAKGKVMRDFEIMANLVLVQLGQIDVLLNKGQLSLSEEEYKIFLENENRIDNMEVKLSDRIVNTIVLFQPVASEIRQIISAYRIVISLERVGDHAVTLVDFLNNIKSLKVYNEFSEVLISMFKSSVELLNRALQAFVQHDKESAVWVLKNCSKLAELNQKMLKKVIDKSKEFDEKKKVIISFITIKEMVDNIERIADHSKNIAEASIYFLEGKDVRHIPFF